MTDNQSFLNEAKTYAKGFEDELEPESLKQAYESLENVQLTKEKDIVKRNQLRLNTLQLWLHLIELLDRHLDPNFNPDDVPERLIQPPPTSKGVVYPPGADPSLIDNPQARAQYEKEIADNQAKITNYTLQVKLRRLDERITPRTKEFIENSYSASEEDQKELTTKIDEMIENLQRKEDLKK